VNSEEQLSAISLPVNGKTLSWVGATVIETRSECGCIEPPSPWKTAMEQQFGSLQ
jgi:hypothetical protein